MTLTAILIPFFSILGAEFLDKSQLGILLLATKTKKHWQLFFGTVLGFVIVDGLAIILGSWITSVVPNNWLKIGAGILFILFGLQQLRTTHEKMKNVSSPRNAFIAGFLVVLVSEMGDKTQIATALFATQYNPFAVFIGVIGALSLLSFLAIMIGRTFLQKINPVVVHRIAGVLFVLLGVSFLLF